MTGSQRLRVVMTKVDSSPALALGAGRKLLAAVVVAASALAGQGAQAETLMSALSSAYVSNPTLNGARANLRAVDEFVPQALSGWRPQVFGEGAVRQSHTSTTPGGSLDLTTSTIGVTVSQNLFRGFRTVNSTKQAEATVRATRASLRNTEQNVLFDSVQVYMAVLTNQAIVELQRQNIEVLSEQLRATRDRFQVGEVTNTDVAQAEAALSGAYTQLNLAEADLLTSKAQYRQIIGRDPVNLAPALPSRSLPSNLDQAVQLGYSNHPAIIAAVYAEEASAFAVKVVEGTLLPTLSLQASADYTNNPSAAIDNSASASIIAQLTIPIYQGGFEYSQVREAKEIRTERSMQIDATRASVRQAVVSAWGTLEAATASITSSQAEVNAAQIALNGVREEANVGQRTTLDVLDAEQTLLDARVSLVLAESARVVASYALVSAVGQLSAEQLALAVDRYQPERHYQQVRDKWFGLRTPSGQ